MSISDDGEYADATHSPESTEINAHFTDEEPISIPNRNFMPLFYNTEFVGSLTFPNFTRFKNG
jgi:hypothetical protein